MKWRRDVEAAAPDPEQFGYVRLGPKRIELNERTLCLHCDAPGPFASCVILRSYAIREGKLISEETHERIACQRCGHQFTIGPDGKFRHAPNAAPYTGEVMPPRADALPKIERPAGEPTEWPQAKKRPPA